MRNWKSLVIALAGAAAAALAGPRAKTREPDAAPDDLPPESASSPAELDALLASWEARIPDLIPGTEKTIVWADPSRPAVTDLAFVYLHGWSATRRETAPLSDRLAARFGANLFYTRLTGHGLPGSALGEATGEDWLGDALEAVEIGRRIGRRVIVIGSSTGGTLATWLALQRRPAESLLALVLLSPNFGPANRHAEKLLWPWGRYLARIVLGSHHGSEDESGDQARYWTWRYPTDALIPMMSLVEAVRSQPLESILTPLYLGFSTHDKVVDPKATRRAFDRFGSAVKLIHDLGDINPGSDHVLAGDLRTPETTDLLVADIAAFLERVMDR